jgi:uncharacterized membrane protein
VYELVLDIPLTGVVVIVPIVITVSVLDAALNIIARGLEPFIRLLQSVGVLRGVQDIALGQFLLQSELISTTGPLTDAIAVFVLVVLIFAIGLLARHRYGEQLIEYFDMVVSLLPGIGTIYASFRRMGDVMLESGVENFREVNPVEFLRDGVFVFGFVTNDAAGSAERGDEGMTTLFLPLVSNPVMGGFLIYIPDDRISDLEMDVKDAVRTIVTSGIATEEPADGEFRQLSDEELRELDTHSAARSSHPNEWGPWATGGLTLAATTPTRLGAHAGPPV